MNVSLTPEMEELIRRKVESGLYNSAGEVVRDALQLLYDRDRLREIKIAELRKEIQKGLDSGPSIPGDEVFARIREKARKRAQRGK
jgi:antitoxin ParD1/3/4